MAQSLILLNIAIHNKIFFRVNTLVNAGADKKKLVLGIPTYARTWNINSHNKIPPVSAIGAGNAGPITREAGFLGYQEICLNVRDNGWTLVSILKSLVLFIDILDDLVLSTS